MALCLPLVIYTVLKLHLALWRQSWGWCGPRWKWVWHPCYEGIILLMRKLSPQKVQQHTQVHMTNKSQDSPWVKLCVTPCIMNFWRIIIKLTLSPSVYTETALLQLKGKPLREGAFKGPSFSVKILSPLCACKLRENARASETSKSSHPSMKEVPPLTSRGDAVRTLCSATKYRLWPIQESDHWKQKE